MKIKLTKNTIFIAVALLIIIGGVIFLLTRNKSDDVSVENPNDKEITTKSAVIYFSYTDDTIQMADTEAIAKEIAVKTYANEFKIEPIDAYPDTYSETLARAEKEKNEAARPAYAGDFDLSKYENIFLGYPVWLGDMPMVVYKFIEDHKWNGKNIYLFSTYDKEEAPETYNTLKEKMTGAQFANKAFGIKGNRAHTEEGILEVHTWLIDNGFMK